MNTSVNPNLLYMTKQISFVITTLGLIGAIVILALNGFIHDGEIVTMLMAAIGAHAIASNSNTPAGNATVGIPPNSAVSVVAPAAGSVATFPDLGGTVPATASNKPTV